MHTAACKLDDKSTTPPTLPHNSNIWWWKRHCFGVGQPHVHKPHQKFQFSCKMLLINKIASRWPSPCHYVSLCCRTCELVFFQCWWWSGSSDEASTYHHRVGGWYVLHQWAQWTRRVRAHCHQGLPAFFCLLHFALLCGQRGEDCLPHHCLQLSLRVPRGEFRFFCFENIHSVTSWICLQHMSFLHHWTFSVVALKAQSAVFPLVQQTRLCSLAVLTYSSFDYSAAVYLATTAKTFQFNWSEKPEEGYAGSSLWPDVPAHRSALGAHCRKVSLK